MALKGNLRDFTITQLLNLINLARKTGTLVIEGPNDTAWVSFREGKLAFADVSYSRQVSLNTTEISSVTHCQYWFDSSIDQTQH